MISDISSWLNIDFASLTSNPLNAGADLYINNTLPTSINIPNGITAIRDYAFYGCRNLKTVNIPDGVTSIGLMAFYNCTNLSSVSLGDGVNKIGDSAFRGCSKLSSIDLPAGVTYIGNAAFSGCSSLTSIIIPANVTYIGRTALGNNSIRDVYISNIERWMTLDRNGDNFGLSYYSLYVKDEKLIDLTIPENITNINQYAFYGCRSIEKITFHKDVTTLMQNAFANCYNVIAIICKGDTPPTCGAQALENISRTGCVVYVPTNSSSTYQSTAPWSEFKISTEEYVGQQCGAPTITFDNETRKLNFTSDTDGATFIYTIYAYDTAKEVASDASGVELSGAYLITAYAQAEGKSNSEKTSVVFYWVNADDESTDIIHAEKQRGVIVSTSNGNINISGTVAGESIKVYNTAGSLVRTVTGDDNLTTISGLTTNAVYIVKIGGTSVKIAL